ncbi:MAG: TadE family protein [Phycisphaerae bacterium]
MLMRKTCRQNRRGMVVVETAVIAPIIAVVLMGMVQAGYLFMVRQTVIMASREGARAGIVQDATPSEVQAKVAQVMASAGMGSTGYTITSNMAALTPTTQEVWVDVSIPLTSVMFFTGNMFQSDAVNITSRVTMHREGA